jgi:hypothetical protein
MKTKKENEQNKYMKYVEECAWVIYIEGINLYKELEHPRGDPGTSFPWILENDYISSLDLCM